MNTPGFIVLIGLLWRSCGAQQRGEWIYGSLLRVCVCVRAREPPAGYERALRVLRVHVAIYAPDFCFIVK